MFFLIAGAAAMLAVAAGLLDRRRAKRRDLDKPGWVPWDVLQILAGIVVVVAIVLAFRMR